MSLSNWLGSGASQCLGCRLMVLPVRISFLWGCMSQLTRMALNMLHNVGAVSKNDTLKRLV